MVIGCMGRDGGAAGLRVERASVGAGFSGVRLGLDSRFGDGSRLGVVKEWVGLGGLWAWVEGASTGCIFGGGRSWACGEGCVSDPCGGEAGIRVGSVWA